jgi:hypothetical protein
MAARDLGKLRALAEGGSITERDFNRLCDLGLATYETRITLRGATCRRTEAIGITEAGERALAGLDRTGDAGQASRAIEVNGDPMTASPARRGSKGAQGR